MANSIISAYRVTFEPLGKPEKMMLLDRLGLDFSGIDFANDSWLSCTVYGPKGVAVIIVFEMKSDFEAYATVLVDDPKGLSRKLLTATFRTIFDYVKRVTVHITPDNRAALGQIWRMGFRYEGYKRRGYDGVRDAVIFGLLPEECPYLLDQPFKMRRVKVTHEQPLGVQ